jgi:ferrous iron transport protein B
MNLRLAGHPNTGKSALFNRLTGQYAAVSNYPGTTVEVVKGLVDGSTIIDTPGMYSLLPVSEEERVSRTLLLDDPRDPVVHVADAKNLDRALGLTLQLIEAGLPLILCINMMDEARKEGLTIDIDRLEEELDVPVAAVTAVTGEGIPHLKRHLAKPPKTGGRIFRYPAAIEKALDRLAEHLPEDKGLSKRFLGLMILKEDPEFMSRIDVTVSPDAREAIERILAETKAAFTEPLRYVIGAALQEQASRLAHQCVRETSGTGLKGFAERLSTWMLRPITGVPILLAILYLGLYKFVGGFGAGTLVNLLEGSLFGKILNPMFIGLTDRFIPWPVVQDLFTGEYGVLTLGLRYAVAIIFPIVAMFFLVFAVIEDSGYLPRLSLLADRLFKKIGLSGRAVIPMVLGLGCDTMATMVTRTLPTKRERFIATVLLALAVPCSAQLGVILALLGHHPVALSVWLLVLIAVFMVSGWAAGKVIPGKPPSFYMEIPPLRLPRISNVLVKTVSRVGWYFVEIFPMFIIASLLIWIGQITGVFGIVLKALVHPVRWLGLPDQTAVAFLFGFFRRDYGVGGLYDIVKAGQIDMEGLIVACVTLTLFLPCIAQFLMNIKERGWKAGIGISVFVLFFSFFVGLVVRLILNIPGVNL